MTDTEVATRRETNQIRRNIAEQRRQDRAFVRVLHEQYPHLERFKNAPINPPDFTWVGDKIQIADEDDDGYIDPIEAAEIKKATQARNRETVIAALAEYRKNSPVGKAILKTVADWFSLPIEAVTGKGRGNYVVSARFVAVRLLREVEWEAGGPRFSFPHIGAMLGGRDHSTILHAYHTFHDRARKYGIMNEAYEALKDAG